MSGKTNFGDTLTTGIQDVSALLPLLGTEQCERHVGSALEKGFLYAAATPLSIFGSLGVVKTAFATLLATITFPFYGGKWLNDAGFGTPGSVSSMVTIANGSAEYGAEVKLAKLLEDQHIDDLDLVEDVEWSGWHNSTDSRSTWWMSWNMKLILTSALAALISVSPYLYLISSDWTDPLSWLFPLLRAFGSFLCVVAIQLALQLRIYHIIRGRLLLMKATQSYLEHRGDGDDGVQNKSPPECEWDTDKKDILEQRVQKLLGFIFTDSERGFVVRHLDVSNALSREWALIVYQLIMAIGIPMIIVGYIGCFTRVSDSVVANGPYIWLVIEAVLSVLRVALWGWNPKWDEGTGMKIKLKLSPDSPLITTPYLLGELGRKHSFISCNGNNFLATATTYAGPLQRFVSSTVSLFYSLVADDERQSKYLLTTILDLYTRTTQTFYIDKNGHSQVFSSTWELDSRTNAMRATLDHELQWNEFRQDDVFNQVLNHSKQIATRLCENGRVRALDLQWTVSYLSPKSDLSVSEIAMNNGDRTYAEVGNQSINKSSLCEDRVAWIRHYIEKWEAIWSLNEWTELGPGIELLHILESVVLEMYLHSKDRITVQELAITDTKLTHRLSAQLVHEMKHRMSGEKESAIERLNKWKMHDDVKQRVIKLWERASDDLVRSCQSDLVRIVDYRLAKIVQILDRGDVLVEKLVSTVFGPKYSNGWPSNPTSERVQHALDIQVRWFARRLKAVLQDGIKFDNFARINFTEDLYLEVNDVSAPVLDSIRLNSSLRVIRLGGNVSTGDINKILEIVANKDTLTTLIGSKSTLSTNILDNHHHILFLPGMTCQWPCTKHPLCALVHRNRQEWRDHARSVGSDVTYTVGFTSSRIYSIIPDGGEILSKSDTECLIMVCTQSDGRLRLSLHHRRDSYGNLSLHIFLRSGEIVSEWKEVHSISKQDIPECYADRPHEIVTPEVAAGYHEILIRIERRYWDMVYYLHSATVTRRESDADSSSEDM